MRHMIFWKYDTLINRRFTVLCNESLRYVKCDSSLKDLIYVLAKDPSTNTQKFNVTLAKTSMLSCLS